MSHRILKYMIYYVILKKSKTSGCDGQYWLSAFLGLESRRRKVSVKTLEGSQIKLASEIIYQGLYIVDKLEYKSLPTRQIE